jgi:hypothetical protein
MPPQTKYPPNTSRTASSTYRGHAVPCIAPAGEHRNKGSPGLHNKPWSYKSASHSHPLTQAPCTPALAHTSSLGTDRTRNARAPTSPRSTGLCAIWICISSSSCSGTWKKKKDLDVKSILEIRERLGGRHRRGKPRGRARVRALCSTRASPPPLPETRIRNWGGHKNRN